MIKNNNLKSKPKSVGNLSVLKALKGTDLIWKKITFKKYKAILGTRFHLTVVVKISCH